MIGMMTIILVCVASISGNPAAGKPWHWKSPKPLVDPKGPGKIPAKTSRIGDGTEATPHSWPHQVALFIDYINFCGGSLISNEWVLTAASCMDDYDFNCERVGFVVMVMGAHNVNEVEASQVEMNSTVFICHENWDSHTLSNDIALIRLSSPVSFNDNIRPVKLPSADDVTVGITVTPTGWMDPHIGKSCRMSDALLQVDVNIKSVSNEYICPYNTGGEIICRGDSGGPLNYNGTIVGIASFGSFARCEDDYPYVFTKVYSYLDWIKSKTGVTP